MEGEVKEEKKEEEKEPEKVKERKEKASKWLSNPYNQVFLGILILAVVIRIYYFSLTSSQPIWWDEADYMAYAKNLAGLGSNWIVTPEHSTVFVYVVAFFFKIGLSDPIIKFILEIIPSILLVFLTYEICILMYKDKRIALIASFLMGTFWELIFYSMRFHLEVPSLFFGFLAIYVFFKGYEKKEKIFKKIDPKWAIPLTALFVILTYSFRRGYFLFGIVFLIYFFLTEKITVIVKDKFNWIALALALILILIVEKFAFVMPTIKAAETYYVSNNPINLASFNVFAAYFQNISSSFLSPLLYLFWIGLLLMIINLALSIGYFKKYKGKIRSDLFTFLMIVIAMVYFIFIQRLAPGSPWGEPRWYYSLLLGTFICVSRGTLIIADYFKKYHKYLPLIIIIILIGYGGYYELQHADSIIKVKLDSYRGIKEASLYIKDVSNPGDLIISVSRPQPAYYAERDVLSPYEFLNTEINESIPLEDFLQELEERPEAKYIIVTFSQPHHPYWMRQDVYTPQGGFAKWIIPFMETEIDFTTGEQSIQQEKSYDSITFTLLTIKDDAFVYKITREK